MDIAVKLFEVLFPVFFIVGIGYYLGKSNPKLDTSFITNFAANIGSPAMVYYFLCFYFLFLVCFIGNIWFFNNSNYISFFPKERNHKRASTIYTP